MPPVVFLQGMHTEHDNNIQKNPFCFIYDKVFIVTFSLLGLSTPKSSLLPKAETETSCDIILVLPVLYP